MRRTQLLADPHGIFLHDAILNSCQRFGEKIAIVDTSCSPARRISYGEYGALIEKLAHGLLHAGLKTGELLAIYLPNSWEFCATYHAATLVGAIPTLLNPSCREREVRYQLENSGAAMLVTDARIKEANLSGLPSLRRVYTTRDHLAGTENFSDLLLSSSQGLPAP